MDPPFRGIKRPPGRLKITFSSKSVKNSDLNFNMAKTKKQNSAASDAASTSNSSISADASTFVKGSEEAREKMAKMRAMKVKGKKAKNIQEMSGLQFPVHKMKRTMKKMNVNNTVTIGAPIYIAAVVEYLCAEVLELSGNAAHDNKQKRISPRYIQLAVNNDEEISKFVGNVTFAQGGVVPQIHPNLLPRTKPSASEWQK